MGIWQPRPTRYGGDDTSGNGAGILAVDAFAEFAVDEFAAIVVAGLDAVPNLGAIHHVGLDVDDRTLVEAIGEEVAGPHVRVIADAGGVTGGVLIRGEAGGGGERGGDVLGDGDLLAVAVREELDEHRPADVVEG
jgi:hypothetical protein